MSACLHCDELIVMPVFGEEDLTHSSPFCCRGCLSVFNILHQKGLESYYEIKKDSAILKRRSPVDLKKQQFQFLDNEDFIKEFAYKNLNNQNTMEFYLEGIHCLACLWLIEKLPEIISGVAESRLDMQKSIVCVSLKNNDEIDKPALFSTVAYELNNLGYRPHVLKKNQSAKSLKQKEERSMLIKIGIAAAGSGNVMMYAISIYAGADGFYEKYFHLLTTLFALPVLFYSALPFYKTAWNALKNKTLSIDVPISMALLMGAAFGIYNQIIGVNENYFDSLTALVFLLLLSRYFLTKIQEEGLSVSDLNFFYQGNSVLLKDGDKFIETHPQYLKIHDEILIRPQEMIPADGVITNGHTTLNSSLLSGETTPVKADIGTYVYSGTMNIDHDIVMRIVELNQETRIGKILKQVESGWIQKSHIVHFTNRISKHFILAVFFLAVILFFKFYLINQTQSGIERALTLLIVTCPCALALATPLTLTRSLTRAAKKGIIIKNDEVIEKLSKVNSIFLDKTGTVTYGMLKIEKIEILNPSTIPPMEIINSLELHSVHPVARALKEYTEEAGVTITHEVLNLTEKLGTGVSGTIGNKFYEIRNGSIFEEGVNIARFNLSDMVRRDSKESIQKLQAEGLSVSLLSGDQKEIVLKIADEIGIGADLAFSEMTPETKLTKITNSKETLMVGDGANDAMALSKAYVGVAVLGAMDISLRAADVYLTYPGISPVADLIGISKETMKVIYRNLVLSLLYNSFSVYAAFTGMISPLVAAIIMPLSSLTVLLSTIIGTRKLNKLLKEN